MYILTYIAFNGIIVLSGGYINLYVIDQVAAILLLERNEKIEMHDKYEKEIKGLPKGTLHGRPNGRKYVYQHFYYCNVKKVNRTRYIPIEQVSSFQKQIERRQLLERTLRKSRKDLEVIERMLKIANKRIAQRSTHEPLGSAKDPPIERVVQKPHQPTK